MTQNSQTMATNFLLSEMAVCAQDWAVLGHLNIEIRSIEPFCDKYNYIVSQREQKDGYVKQHSAIIGFSWTTSVQNGISPI